MSDELVRVSEARLEGVGKRFGTAWAVREVSIGIRPGELYALLGPTGSGKTTILRLLAGFEVPDEGRVFVDDEWIDPVPPRRRNLGMVFPGYALWPHLTVFDNVALGLREHGVRGEALRRRVAEALAQVGLEGLEGRRPAQLSGGEPPRVALARALAVRPRLLLLDDPLSALDAPLRPAMRRELERLHRAAGITTVLATRDPAEALALATRIAVVGEGRVVQEGRPEDVYWRPRSRFVAELAGAATLLPVRVVERRDLGVVVETAGGARLPVAAGGRAWAVGEAGLLCLRPEALSLEEAERAHGGLRGSVTGYAFEGGRQRYEVAVPGGSLRVEMLTSAALGRGFRAGDRVKVEIAPETAILLPAGA